MDHAEIEEQNVVDRYVRGSLQAEEAARFEEHYLSCHECLDRLELAESMKRGFQRAAGQDVGRAAAARQIAVVAWLSRLGRSRQAAVLAMALLVAVLLPALVLRQGSDGGQASAEAEALRSQLEASRRDLAQERQARVAEAAELAQARQPQGNVPIVFLGAERGAASEPTQRIPLPPGPGSIILALPVEPPHQPTYRVTLRDAGGRQVWRSAADLRIDERETLGLHIPSAFLAPGDYTLTVEGIATGKPPVPSGRFTFRILPPD